MAAAGMPEDIVELIQASGSQDGSAPAVAEAVSPQDNGMAPTPAITRVELELIATGMQAAMEIQHVNAVLNSHAMWRGIDAMKQQMDSSDSLGDDFVVEVVSTTGLGLLAGIVAYALRGGALLASMLSMMPLWVTYDPLPILAKKKRDNKDQNIRREDLATHNASAPEDVDALFE